jgi:hypothetical protein
MFLKKTRSALLSAVMTVGIAGVAPTFAFAKDSPKDREEWVKYEDVPRSVRTTLDRERGRYDIKRIDHVTRNGRDFYRASLDTKGDTDTVIRVGDNGKVLSSAEVAELDPNGDRLSSDEKWIKYEDTPRAVRQSLDRERGNHEVKQITQVNRGGREFYRAIIDDKGNDRVVRFDTSGRVLSSEDVGDVALDNGRGVQRSANQRGTDSVVVKYNSLPARVKETLDRERGNRDLKIIYDVTRADRHYYNAIIDERDGDRSVRINDAGKLLSEEDLREVRTAGARYEPSSADIRRGVEDDGTRVAFDRLPGDVKTTLGHEAGQDRVGNVYRYDRRGQSTYEAEVYGPTGTRVIRVNENGRIINDRDTTAEGRRSIRFDDLPGAVKQSLGRDLKRNQIERVVEITDNGHTYYRAQVHNGRDRDPTWVTVDENGRTVRDYDRTR